MGEPAFGYVLVPEGQAPRHGDWNTVFFSNEDAARLVARERTRHTQFPYRVAALTLLPDAALARWEAANAE